MRGLVAASPRYSHVAIAFHWVIAALAVADPAIGLLHERLSPGTMGLHQAFCRIVLALPIDEVAAGFGHGALKPLG